MGTQSQRVTCMSAAALQPEEVGLWPRRLRGLENEHGFVPAPLFPALCELVPLLCNNIYVTNKYHLLYCPEIRTI